jgi:hypothetical protein
MKEGVAHSQLENALAQELVEGLIRDEFDDSSQRVKRGAGL